MLPIFIDIDGTLTDKPHGTWGNVYGERIAHLKSLLERGYEVVLWTGGGTSYAKAFAEKFDLMGAICIGKPGCIVDDNPDIRPQGRIAVLSPDKFLSL